MAESKNRPRAGALMFVDTEGKEQWANPGDPLFSTVTMAATHVWEDEKWVRIYGDEPEARCIDSISATDTNKSVSEVINEWREAIQSAPSTSHWPEGWHLVNIEDSNSSNIEKNSDGTFCMTFTFDYDTKDKPDSFGPWRRAIDEALVVNCLDCTSDEESAEDALARLIKHEVTIATDPVFSSQAHEEPKDTKRLDYLDKCVEPVVEGQSHANPEGEHVANKWVIVWPASTIREAIDAQTDNRPIL